VPTGDRRRAGLSAPVPRATPEGGDAPDREVSVST